ncbi:hypothetical protein L195_g053823 [Trifolium pratense]|uniref:Uncharacterized protein n=1 Tax=Trifolium pratense TaxID=57577 RepID=A0A2K3KCP1_TRIPR|nr:hypothetical protein L195_g053823 [Trifolium pratense]
MSPLRPIVRFVGGSLSNAGHVVLRDVRVHKFTAAPFGPRTGYDSTTTRQGGSNGTGVVVGLLFANDC